MSTTTSTSGSPWSPRITSEADQIDFLEEWKAKREKLRMRSLPAVPSTTQPNDSQCSGVRGEALRPASAQQHVSPNEHRSQGSNTPKSGNDERGLGNVSQSRTESSEKAVSPSPSSKEKSGSLGSLSYRKNKTQVEKRKLREKRRSTGVVNLSLRFESSDEDKDVVDREKQPSSPDLLKLPSTVEDGTRVSLNKQKRCTGNANLEDQSPVNRTLNSSQNRLSPEGEDAGYKTELEKNLHELEKEIIGEKRSNQRLKKQLQEKEDLVQKLQAEIGLMNKDMDSLEDENQQLREENKTLLRVVNQLTSS
ncbi:PRKC apoptosis WT1 regulator protein-like [Erpetoichthys calabaricus]|uniref:PRKC apoptosis WT1 regulator protein-like n=1 Tax=Erpetoichthys calabaricus TaxID=27687 RepID=UPI002234E446|nr:PRKC apoptosis WT1 regulator protein-like [Erpetoichthys calabaricus]